MGPATLLCGLFTESIPNVRTKEAVTKTHLQARMRFGIYFIAKIQRGSYISLIRPRNERIRRLAH